MWVLAWRRSAVSDTELDKVQERIIENWNEWWEKSKIQMILCADGYLKWSTYRFIAVLVITTEFKQHCCDIYVEVIFENVCQKKETWFTLPPEHAKCNERADQFRILWENNMPGKGE